MDGGLGSRCVGRVYGADGAVSRTAPSFFPSSQKLSYGYLCDAHHWMALMYLINDLLL